VTIVYSERVHFKLIVMPCCSHMLCWVNPRYPSYCPECGTFIYPQVRGCVTTSDDQAMLRVHADLSSVNLKE